MYIEQYKTYYRRNLPHYQTPGETFFVTFRLAGSLPVHIIRKLQEEQELKLKYIAEIKDKKIRYEAYQDYQQNYFYKFDACLDRYKDSPRWLGKEIIAETVKEAILYRDNKDYELIAFTIMPNHVHIIFTPIVGRTDCSTNDNKNNNDGTDCSIVSRTGCSNVDRRNRPIVVGRTDCSTYIVTGILKSLKWNTALKCNKVLNRSGAFWQHESYDHTIRNNNELYRVVKYILNNPVKTGLCEKWEDWKWSYCNFKFLE